MRRSRYNWECSNRRKECYSSKGQGSLGQVSAVKDNLISFGSLIEPKVKAQIIAEKGPIVIGNDNLIEEGVIIKNSNEETLYVGNENIFEVQSQFEGDSFHMTHVTLLK